MRENISIVRISNSRIFESKQKTGVEDTLSNDYIFKEVSISGGDESHLFKIETISSVVEFMALMQAWSSENKSKTRVSEESLDALNGGGPQSREIADRTPIAFNQNKVPREESTLASKPQDTRPDKPQDTIPDKQRESSMRSSGSIVTQNDFKLADRKLNELYQRAMRRLNSNEQEKLKREQREWIKEKESYSKRFPEDALRKQVEMTNERIIVIERMIN